MEFNDRVLAIVLLDLISSTAFVQKVGARKAAEWLQYHDRLARSLLYKFRGREIDRSDGFMLSFDSPVDAVNFCLHYQMTIPKKIGLNSRIGIHWGKVVEVVQDELFVGVGAKGIELEGISKNIAARTMSICQPGQVLLTKDAMKAVKGRSNLFTPPYTRYACVGLYRFKGVEKDQEIYAVGTTIKSLQPPPSSEKVKRMGGPRKIRSRMRDRRIKERLVWFSMRISILMFLYLFYLAYPCLTSENARKMWGIDHLFWWMDYVKIIVDTVFWAVEKSFKDLGLIK